MNLIWGHIKAKFVVKGLIRKEKQSYSKIQFGHHEVFSIICTAP